MNLGRLFKRLLLPAVAGAALAMPQVVQAQHAPLATETPRHGGTLDIGTVYLTLAPLSWDPRDWGWKFNHDTGQFYEQLFAADLSKAEGRGGKHKFVADAWLPADAIRGELAEKWEWQDDPLAVVVTLRKGVMFPEKPGVMASRELTAEDVVYAFDRVNTSPQNARGFFDYIEKMYARDKYTLVIEMNRYHSEWNYRFGYGHYSGIVPREVIEAGATNWKNANGTGPFTLADVVQGNSNVYVKNPNYWDSEKIDGKDYKLPFVDKVVFRFIKDEATWITALRTAKLDILESVRWQNVESLKKSSPALKWRRWLGQAGIFLSMDVNTKPFDDIRVRRALNMAVNKQEIVDAYYNGHAELFAYPQHPDFGGYFQPLSEMPTAVKELFEYNPQKAKALLAEAGYPNGFTFKTQVCSCFPDHMELLPLVAGYLARVGVKIEIQPMEPGAYFAALAARKMTQGYFFSIGHSNPTTTLTRNFRTGSPWNPSGWADPAFDEKITAMYALRDETERQAHVRAMTVEMLEKAPYIWLPTPYAHTAWWPWVKNYNGELRAGAVRPGPIYARIWIDQALKKKLGY